MVFERNGLNAEDGRALRRAFIAACEAAHADAIARVHPARGPDGRPLVMDSVALGPRDAARAVLVLSDDARGSRILTGLLRAGLRPPPQMRLVLVHALDPPAFAGHGGGDPAWPAAMLQAVATEDLSRVTRLTVLDLTALDLQAPLRAALPQAQIAWSAHPPGDAAAWVRDNLATE